MKYIQEMKNNLMERITSKPIKTYWLRCKICGTGPHIINADVENGILMRCRNDTCPNAGVWQGIRYYNIYDYEPNTLERKKNMDKKKLWLESDRASDGTPFIAQDKEISEEDNEPKTYIRLDEKHPNAFSKSCEVCGKDIRKGWEGFDDDISYCDDHVEIMN